MNMNNRKKTLSVYPDIKEIDYGSKIRSDELNKQIRSIEESALRAILRGREINSELDRIKEGVILSHQAMANFYGSLNYESADKIYASSYSVPNNRTNSGGIFYDVNYGYTTLNPIGKYSKIPRGERYDGRVSPQVSITQEEFGGTNTYEYPKDSEIYDTLDGTNKTFWYGEVMYGEILQCYIRIDLPPSLTKRFNYIEVFPFPLYGCKILDIEYKSYGGSYTSVAENIYGGNPIQNNVGEAIKLYLAPKEFNGTIRLKLEMKEEFGYVGLTNVDVKFLDFDNTTKHGYLKFRGIDTKTRPFNITLKSLFVDWYLDTPKAQELVTSNQSPITMRLIKGTEADDGTLNQVSDWEYKIDLADIDTWNLNNMIIQLDTNESLFLEFTLTEHNTTTPVIRGAKIEYEGL